MCQLLCPKRVGRSRLLPCNRLNRPIDQPSALRRNGCLKDYSPSSPELTGTMSAVEEQTPRLTMRRAYFCDCGRSDLNDALISALNTSGCSHAAKCVPLSSLL